MGTITAVPTQQTNAWMRENLPNPAPGARGFEKWCQPPKWKERYTNLQDMEAGEESLEERPSITIENLNPITVETITGIPDFIPHTSTQITAVNTQPLLSILIPTVIARKKSFDALMRMLNAQRNALPNPELVEIVTFCDDGKMMVGAKRNRLLDMAAGEYLCFADDDDRVFSDFIEQILTALETRPDVLGIGLLWTDNHYDAIRVLYRTLDYKNVWFKVHSDVLQFGRPAHLNPTRSSIAKSVRFNETVISGEDAQWSAEVSRKLKTCVHIDDPIYHYRFMKAGTLTQRPGAREAMRPELAAGHQYAYRDKVIVELDERGMIVERKVEEKSLREKR